MLPSSIKQKIGDSTSVTERYCPSRRKYFFVVRNAMTTLKSKLTILFSIFFGLSGLAQTTKTIDSLKAIDQACLDSGWHMSSCEYRYLIAIDSILNAVYTKLQSKLNSSERATLKIEQANWLRQRDIYYKQSDQEFEDSL